jgi:hypothetical protein
MLSDDVVWSFSSLLDGEMDPSSFSIQLPQIMVYKAAEEVLSKYTKEEEFNYGKLLPSKLVFLEVLKEIHTEQQNYSKTLNLTIAAPLPVQPNKPNNKKKNNPKQLSVSDDLRSKIVNSPWNTLVRFLSKIPARDVRILRENVFNVSNYYLFYQFNETLPKDAPPLTASHTFPNGQVIRLFENFLLKIKKKGIVEVNTQCKVILFFLILLPFLIAKFEL